jgi:centriolar protein POC1
LGCGAKAMHQILLRPFRVKRRLILSLRIITQVAFHPNGTAIASASTDKSIKVWDIRTNKLLQHYKAHTDVVNSICFHPNGKFLLSTSNEGPVKIWDYVEGHLFYTLHSHKGATTAGAFSANGDYFATAGTDHQVLTWKTNFDVAEEQENFISSRIYITV